MRGPVCACVGGWNARNAGNVRTYTGYGTKDLCVSAYHVTQVGEGVGSRFLRIGHTRICTGFAIYVGEGGGGGRPEAPTDHIAVLYP